MITYSHPSYLTELSFVDKLSDLKKKQKNIEAFIPLIFIPAS